MSSSTGPNNPGGGGDAHQPPPTPPRSLASTAAAMAAAAGASYHGNQLVFVVNPLPSTEEQLNERILDSAERLRSQSTTNAANNNNSQTSAAAPNPIPVITIRDDQTLSTSTSSGGLTSDLMTNNDEPSSSPWTTAFSSSQTSPFLHSSQGPSTSTAAESVEQQQQQQMPRPSVLQCVISHGYVAVLLEDHRVCRFQYNIYPERIANAESSSKSSLSANNSSSSGGGSHRLSSLSSSGSNSLVAGGGGGGSSSARTVQTARRRLIRHSARGPRGGPGGSASATAASVIMGHRGAVIPAQFVPEDLINQAQVVLQGKSRNVIIRELQRTNLDVNLAVNNLLSRDDEEYDDGDDGGPEQMIQSDDLMSLLDSGFGPNESVIIDSDFADEVFSYPLRIRSSSSALFNSGSGSSSGAAGSASGNAPPTIRSARESRLRDEAFSFIERDFMSGGSGGGSGGTGSGGQKSRWYSYPVEKGGGGGCFDSLSTRQRPLKTSSSTSASASSANDQGGSSVQLAPISFADQGQAQEFWPTGDVPDRKFVAIASLTSELIAITAKGELCQWRWADAEPFRGQLPDGTPYWHPRAPALGLMAPAEKVTLVAGSCIRATVATESGKLATWIDESIAPVASKLEHPATSSIFEGGGSLGGSTSSLQSLHHHHHHHHHQLHHTQHQQQGQQHRITSLHVSSLMSVVQLSSGAIYWWGVPPFAHRKKLVEKVKNERNGGGSNSASKSASKSSSKSSSQTSSKQQQQQEEIVLGSLVCMRNSPLYQAGSIAFTTVGGLPKVGQLVNSAWKITDSCSFRVLSPAEIAARAAPPSASIGKTSTTSLAASASTSNTGKTGASSATSSSSDDLNANSKTVEMPPPPSPASSTSSEPGGYSSGSGPLPKRAKRSSNNGGSGSGSGATAAPENSSSSSSSKSGEGANQQQGAQAIDRVEMWSLKDIVFMEDVRNLPVGRVIKVDGNYVAVKFTGGQGTSSSSTSTSAMLGEAIPPGSSLGTSGSSSSTSAATTTTTSAAARVSHLLTGFQQQQQQEHSLLFQAAMMGGGDQRGGNGSGSFSPGGPRSSSSQGGGGGGGGGSSASSTDSMKTGAGGGGSQAAESFTFENFMQDCRLMRKDELTVVKPTALPPAATSSTSSTSAASTSAAGTSASTSAPSVQGTTTSSAASPINITGGGNGSSSQQGQQTQQQQQTGAANPLGSKAANDCLQRAPKRVHLPENVQILAMTLSNLGLHCIAKIGGYRFSYILVNIVTGRVESDAKIPIEYSTFFGSAGGGGGGGKVPTSTSKIALYSAGETDSTTVVLCRDGNGTLYPLAKDCTETLIRDPIALNLGPVSTIGLGIFGLPGSTGSNSSSSSSSNSSKTHAAIVGLAFEPQLLMSAILKSDLDLVRARLEMLEAAPAVFGPMVGELCDGNHNILHIAVSACFPSSNKTGGGGGGGNGSSTSSTSSTSTTSASSGAGASAAGAVSSATTAAERLISNMFESDEILNLQVMSLDQAENSSNSSSSNKDKDTSASAAEQQQQSTPMDTSNSQTQQTQQQNHHHQHHNSADYIAEPPLDPSEQKPIAHSILWTLLDSPALQPYLLGLLSARDFNGLTPFMFAVSGRAYSAAIQLLLIMQRVARQAAVGAMTGFDQGSSLYAVYLGDLVKRTLETMLYPRGSLPDHSPLYMLCSNDTCSFTWTGEEHINQDIFECRTCGLVGSLCCCTECARVCHRGHDCKLKRTSPTAYCDCWEKCKCKALIGGCQPARFALLKRLLEATDLSLRPNARGEHLLLFLVQTVGRQIGEQRQYRPARVISGGASARLVSSSGRRMAPNSGDDEPGGGGGGGSSSVPDHDLEPPKFARRALETLLGDWATVKSMILTGYRAPPETFKTEASKTSSSGANSGGENAGTGSGGGKRRRSSSSNASTSTSNLNTSSTSTSHHHLQLFNSGSFFSGTAPAYALEEENAYLGRQNGSALLDKFTHSLLRIGLEMIERLIGTLLAACSNQLPEAKVAARRFVRSVARVGLVVAFELNPTAYASLVPMMNSGGGGLTSASIAGIAPKESSSGSSSSSSNNSIGAASFGTMMEQALSGSRSANGFPSYLFSKRGKGSSSSSLSSLGGGGGSGASASAAAADTALAILGKCRRIFVSFLPIAIEELCEVAESLVVPVKRGLARPSGAFVLAPSSSEVLAATEELFNVDASVLAAHQQRDFLDSAFGLGEGAMELGVPPPPPVVLPAPVPPPTTSSLVMMVPPPPAPQQIHPQPVIVPPQPPTAAASTSSASNFSGAFPASSQEPGPSGLQQQQPLPPRVVVDASVINEEAMDTDAPGGGSESGGGRRSPSAQELLEEIGAGMEEASSEAAASSSMDGSEAAGPSSRRHQMNALLEDMLADEDSNAGGGGNNRGGAGGNGGNQDHPHHHQLHHHHHHHLHPHGNVPGGGGADSDSDSSSSNPDDAASYLSTADNASMAQRSVVTGATAGSDVGVSSLPYDDESVNSPGEEVDDDDEDEDDEGEGAEDDEQQMNRNHHHHHHHQGGEDDRDEDEREEGEEDDRDEDDDEDEDDEDGGSDASDTVETENEGDEIQFIDDGGGGPLEAPRFLGISTGGRGGGGSARSNILHHVQWALRQRGGGSGTGSDGGTANAVSSISASLDPSSAASFRRAVAANQQANALVSTTGENVVSMANSAVGLARAFSIVIRQIGDLMPVLRAGPGELAASGVLYLAFTSLEAMALQNSVEERLKGTWEWLIGSLDSTETQLRFGCALSNRRLTSASISPISVGGGGVSASAAASISHAVAFSNSSAANSGAAAVSAAGAGGSSGGVGAASVGGSSSLRRLRAIQAASAAANSGSSAGSGASGAAAASAASADADLLFLPALSRSSHSSSLRRMSMVSGGGNQNTSSLATRPISPGTSGGIRVASSGGGGGTSAASASSAVAAANTLSATDSNSSRRDFLNYAMSLMRAHSNEHYDSLPVLDVASLKHLAYVFDAFIYYMRRGLPADPNQTANVPPTGDYQQHPDQPLFDLAMVGHSSPSPLNNAALAPLLDLALICPPTPVPPKTEQDILEGEEPEQRPVVNTSGRKSRFFRRSASTLYLGCPPPDPFSAPFYEALPLASKPHLLTPSARREQLFGVPRPSSAREAERLLEALPAQMSLTRRTVNGGSGSSSSSIFADGGQISSAPAATPIPKASTSTSSNIIQNSPSGGKPSVIVLAGSAKHPKLGTSSTSSSNDPQMTSIETDSKSTTSGYMSVIAKAGQYNAAHADVKSLMANHYYGSLERHDALLGRWRLSLELFGRLFVDDVGLEPGSIMPELSGFPVKETKFRREMERLRNPTGGSQGSGGHGHHGHHGGHHHGGHHSSSGASSSGGSIRDLFLKVDRDRALLLAQTFKELNAVFASHTRRLPSNSTPSASSLAITRVKVTFREEPGEGSGVVRGFYTAFSEAVLANEKLPALDWLLPGGPGTGSGGSSTTSTTASSSATARSSSTGYGTAGSGSPATSSSAFASNHFNLIRATNMAINVGLSSPSSSLAQAVSNALQAESGGGGGGRGGSGSPGGSSSAPPSAAASGSSTPSGGAEELLRRPRSPSRPRYAGGLSSSRRSHIERIRHELRNSALEDFRRSSRSSPYGSSAGQSPPASSSSSASMGIPVVLPSQQPVQHVPIIQPIPSASSSSSSSMMLSLGSGSGRHRSSSGTGSNGGPVLRYDSPAFVPTAAAPNAAAALLRPAASSPMSRETETRNALGSRIYSRVFPLQPSAAGKITGMLLDLPSHDLLPIITSEEEFRAQVEAAMEIINAAEGSTARSSTAASGTPPPSSSSAGANPSASSSASTPSSPPEFEAGFIDALLSAGLSQQAPPPPASVAPAPSMLRLSDFDGLVVSGGGRDPRESSGSGSSSSQPVSFPDHHLENHVLLFPLSSSSAAAAATSSPSATSTSSTSTAFPPLPPPPVISTLLPAEDNAPLFYQPGPRGFYSPRLGRGTEARLNAFRNVGRIIGICFVQNELCPITLNRHVIKYILGRPIGWHDLAFFDPDLYESLRQLILDAESPGREEVFAQLDFRFSIDLSREEGGGEVELLPGGRHLRVTPANVLNYVQRYAMHRMLYSAAAAIMALKAGVFDVLPARSFEGLTAEDFRLLLNGVNEINVSLLQSYVTFHDESGDGAEHLSYFRRWFWWVLERMTNEEKQDLVYFWTGSPALPASEEGFQPMPSITIRPRDDMYFVTANTCISRLYIPLYTTRSILRTKLLTSIKAKSFGFI